MTGALMQTAQDFWEFCMANNACEESHAHIANKTALEFWDETKRGDWLLWLRNRGAWDFAPEQFEKYLSVIAPVHDEWERELKISEKMLSRSPEESVAYHVAATAKYNEQKAVLIRQIVANPFA